MRGIIELASMPLESRKCSDFPASIPSNIDMLKRPQGEKVAPKWCKPAQELTSFETQHFGPIHTATSDLNVVDALNAFGSLLLKPCLELTPAGEFVKRKYGQKTKISFHEVGVRAASRSDASANSSCTIAHTHILDANYAEARLSW